MLFASFSSRKGTTLTNFFVIPKSGD